METAKCSQCYSKIEEGWLLHAEQESNYVCPNCGTTYQFTVLRQKIKLITYSFILLLFLYFQGLSEFVNELSKSQTMLFWGIFLIVCYFIINLPLLFTPTIFKKSETQRYIKKNKSPKKKGK